MSSYPPASDLASPGTPVRSSEALCASQDASAPTSSAEPEAITSTTQTNGSESFSGGDHSGKKHQEPVSQSVARKSISEECEGSNATTPRLPPAKLCNHDVDSIPAQDMTTLEVSSPPNELSDVPRSPSHSSASDIPHTSPVSKTTVGYSQAVGTSSSKEHENGLGNRFNGVSVSDPHFSSEKHNSNPKDSTSVETQQYKYDTFVPINTKASKSSDNVSSGGMEINTEGNTSSRSAREDAFSEQRNRSSSRSSQGRVEKSIEATLAEEAPSTNARSRKSSHMLGLFRENTAPLEGKKKSQSTRLPQGALGDTKWNKSNESVDVEPESRPAGARSMTGPENRYTGKDSSATISGPVNIRRESSGESQHGVSRSGPTMTGSMPELLQTDKAVGEDSLQDVISRASKQKQGDNTSRKRLPTRLLEEIREHHNVGTPFHDKFRTTQTKPNAQRTSSKDDQSMEQNESSKDKASSSSKITHEDSSTEEHETEDDESDKEQISSALYYPHQAPSPDALQDVNIDEARSKKEKAQEDVSLLPEAALSPSAEAEASSDDVDINLQSHNRSRHLHGDLLQARPPSITEHDVALETSSSTSESETESAGSSSQTDDAELTPRASPTSKLSFFQTKNRKPRPAAPLGAVELKPYNHQVGGHTTVFRFSKRAVCKQLTSRENRFYELVEQHHPELLKFLPK